MWYLVIHRGGNRAGQTMLELIIAIFIILTALGGIATMVTMSVRGQERSEETVIAYNLAREGIEVARAMRDNTFTTGIRSTSCSTICTTLRNNSTAHVAYPRLFTPSPPADKVWYIVYNSTLNYASSQAGVCWNSTEGYFHQFYSLGCDATNVDVTRLPTRFRRLLTIDYICLNPSTNAECVNTSDAGCTGAGSCAGYTQFIGHRVTSRVQVANRKGGAAEVITLEDYLYAWK